LKKMVAASQDQPRLEATIIQADENVQHPLVPGLARQF